MVNRRRDVLCFRVELRHIQPAIWRRILVPARCSFWDLHVAIQDAMGWQDYHLHEFHVPTGFGEQPAVFGIPDDEFWDQEREILAGWEYSVVKLWRYAFED